MASISVHHKRLTPIMAAVDEEELKRVGLKMVVQEFKISEEMYQEKRRELAELEAKYRMVQDKRQGLIGKQRRAKKEMN